MDENPIGDAGARHLMHALSQNKSLKFLGLQVSRYICPKSQYLDKSWNHHSLRQHRAAQGSNLTSTVAQGEAYAARFNPACPDGTYELNLALQTERTVAVQLCQLNNDAPEDHMRNVKLDGQTVSNLKSLDWPDRLPTSGVLTATFITSKARRTMTVIESKKLAALQAQFSKPMMSDTERLNIANMLAPHHVFLCSQIKSMLSNFSMGDERVEAAVMMFTRALDTDESLDQLMEPLHERERRQFYEKLSFYGFYVFANATGNHSSHSLSPALLVSFSQSSAH